ncbi:unnamed protein product [Cylicocyclus nassatus]|uniref:Uncharacterized protein n=1 Tax=Cylicocyclus nassatus TaxID=53992 RepID=A0AA36H8C6_CYLNA|nr:unnamed protein product [Cylicocyclus nassatus]
MKLLITLRIIAVNCLVSLDTEVSIDTGRTWPQLLRVPSNTPVLRDSPNTQLGNDHNDHLPVDLVTRTERRKQIIERSWQFHRKQKLHSGQIVRRASSYAAPLIEQDGVLLFKEYDDDDRWQPFRVSMVSGDVRATRDAAYPGMDVENGIVEDDQYILVRSLQRTTMSTPIVPFTEIAEVESDIYGRKRRRSSRVFN